MKKTLLVCIIALFSTLASAQFMPKKEINVQIGAGFSSAYEGQSEVFSQGFYAQGEFILKGASWFELRPYLGFITTSSDGTDIYGFLTEEKAETKAALLGAKVRVRIPIPWVAPYIEAGAGTSIGSFETITAKDSIIGSGMVFHIPFSFGLEIGRNYKVDLGAKYYFQSTVDQFAGAVSLGFTFPIGQNKK